MQVFAQPVFALLESTLASHTCWPGSARALPKNTLAFTEIDAESAWSPAASTSASASLPATAAKAGGAGGRQSAAALGLSGLTAAGTLPLLLATSSRHKQWPASELEMEPLESRAPLMGGAAAAMVGRQASHGKREDAGGSRSGGSAAEGRRGAGEGDGGVRERGGGALCGRSPAGAGAGVSGQGQGLHRGAKAAAGGQGVLPVYMRVGLRSLYVLLISLLAAAVPYFHLVISLIGALTFWLPVSGCACMPGGEVAGLLGGRGGPWEWFEGVGAVWSNAVLPESGCDCSCRGKGALGWGRTWQWCRGEGKGNAVTLWHPFSGCDRSCRGRTWEDLGLV